MYYMAAGYEALTGLSCADLYANPDLWMDALHPDDQDRGGAAMDARGAGVQDDERDTVYRLVHPGASAREVRVCSWPVRDDDGFVLFRAGIVIDITDCAEGAAVPPRMYAGADMERRGFAD
jgi:PAS domain-containing protein